MYQLPRRHRRWLQRSAGIVQRIGVGVVNEHNVIVPIVIQRRIGVRKNLMEIMPAIQPGESQTVR